MASMDSEDKINSSNLIQWSGTSYVEYVSRSDVEIDLGSPIIGKNYKESVFCSSSCGGEFSYGFGDEIIDVPSQPKGKELYDRVVVEDISSDEMLDEM